MDTRRTTSSSTTTRSPLATTTGRAAVRQGPSRWSTALIGATTTSGPGRPGPEGPEGPEGPPSSHSRRRRRPMVDTSGLTRSKGRVSHAGNTSTRPGPASVGSDPPENTRRSWASWSAAAWAGVATARVALDAPTTRVMAGSLRSRVGSERRLTCSGYRGAHHRPDGSAVPRLPAEPPGGEHQGGRSPDQHDHQVAGAHTRTGAALEGADQGGDHVADGEPVGDLRQDRAVADRVEDARDEDDREVDPVDHGRGGVRVGDDDGHGQAEGAEGHDADHQRHHGGQRVVREVEVVEGHADADHDDGQHRHVDHDAADDAAHVRADGDGGPPHALQHTRVPPVADDHAQVGVASGDQAEGQHRHHGVLVVAEGRARHAEGAGRGAHHHQEDHREHEGEHGGHRVAPVRLLLVAHLLLGDHQVVHGRSRLVSARYTSSSEGRLTVSPASTSPRSTAHPVSAWRTSVGSSIRNSTTSPRCCGSRPTGSGSVPTDTPEGSTKRTVVIPWSRPPRVSGGPEATTRPAAMTVTESARTWASSM